MNAFEAEAAYQAMNKAIAEKDEAERKQRLENDKIVVHMPTGPAV